MFGSRDGFREGRCIPFGAERNFMMRRGEEKCMVETKNATGKISEKDGAYE
jgi:hypothetical protein